MRFRSASRRRRIALGLAVAAVVTAVSMPAAFAHKKKFDGNVQLKITNLTETTAQYSGKVSSEKAKCRARRIITVSVNGVPIATATSLKSGFWAVWGPRQPKGAFVVAHMKKRFTAKSRKHRHKCKFDTTHKRALN